jgi:PAS domain S-box-containing protein
MVKKTEQDPEKTIANRGVNRKMAAQDTKKRRASGDELGEPERCLSSVMQCIPDAVMVIDHKGTVTAWNHAMEDLTGVKAEEIIGKGNYEYALPFYGVRRPVLADIAMKPAEEIERTYKHILRRGNTLIAEAYVTHLPGGPAFVYGSATTLKNSRGEIFGVMEIVCELKK